MGSCQKIHKREGSIVTLETKLTVIHSVNIIIREFVMETIKRFSVDAVTSIPIKSMLSQVNVVGGIQILSCAGQI